MTVLDVEASATWYQRVLGLERQFEEPHHHSDRGGYAVVLGTADMSLNIGLDHHPANTGSAFDPTRTGLDHVCFQVSDTDALAAWATHLVNTGSPTPASTRWRAHRFFWTFNDPDGIQLELIAFAG